MGHSVRLFCGDKLNQDSYISLFESKGVDVNEAAYFHVLIDRPLGWATLDHSGFDYARGIIFTDNFCPSYQLDLMVRKPLAVVSLGRQDNILSVLTILGEKRRIYPVIDTPLTESERQILRLAAKGLSNKEIAKQRTTSESTVKNQIQSIYNKLNLRSRVQIAHYYYGLWHLLEDWNRPAFLTDSTRPL